MVHQGECRVLIRITLSFSIFYGMKFWSKIKLSWKKQNFGQKMNFCSQIEILVNKIKSWSKTEIFVKKSYCGPKMKLWKSLVSVKIIFFQENFSFWPKFYFLTNSLVYDQNFIFFGQKFEFLTKMLFFDEEFSFRPNWLNDFRIWYFGTR